MKVILIPLLALAVLSSDLTSQSTQLKPIVFTHVTIIDGSGAPAKPDMTVAITGNRITELGPGTDVRVPQGAQVVDATGKFMIPGLWDMHVHWFRYDKAFLQLFPINGVTGVRIMWGGPIHFGWRKEIQEEGTLLGPRMAIAGNILDGPKPIWPGSMAISNEAEAREAVISTKQQGYDFVKVYSLLPRKAYFAIADEAKKQHIPFAGHVPYSVSVAEASDAGQKSIEHLTGILAACSSHEEEVRQTLIHANSTLPGQRRPNPSLIRPITRLMLDTFSAAKANALFARLKQNQTWQCPTFTVLRSGAFMDDSSFRNDPRLKYMPAQLRASWDPSNDFRFRTGTMEDFRLARSVYKKQIEIAGLMHKAGVEFIAGTDVLNPFCFPGFSLHDELAILVEAGLSPMEALQTATLNPARFLGIEKAIGTVAQGKIADLVLLDANPLDDIRNTTKINAVVVNGRLLDRTALDQRLTQVRALAQK